MTDLSRRFRCVVGPPRSGKSQLTRPIFGRAHRGLAVSYDPEDRYPGRACATLDELATYMWAQPFFRAVFNVRDGQEDEDFAACCELVLLLQKENKERRGGRPEPFALICEELALYPSAKDPYGAFAEICRQGRHLAIDAAVITQAPGELSLPARNAMTDYYFFQTVEINALDFVRQTLGPERAAQVRALPPFVPLHYDREARTMTPPLDPAEPAA